MTNETKQIKRRSHPGVFIKDAIEALDMSSKEFSIRTGISERTISDLINEKGNITFDIATKLGDFFGNSTNTWTNLQNMYDAYILEKEHQKEIEEDYLLLKPFSKYLLDNHFIEKEDDRESIVRKTRSIVSVNKLSLLNSKELLVSFKEQNISLNSDNYFAQNFWLAYALTKSREIQTETYDKKKIIGLTDKLKELMFERPSVFYDELVKYFSECGISFVFVPYLTKSYIYGATKWLNKDRVMLAISNRTNRADLFWFTLFHELSHVLQEHKRYCLFQMNDLEDEEADEEAANLLIPKPEWDKFVKYHQYFTNDIIVNFARQMMVPTFIVVGRLVKEKRISYANSIYQDNMINYDNQEFLR